MRQNHNAGVSTTVRSVLATSLGGILWLSAAQPLYASGTTAYVTQYRYGNSPEAVYKSVDESGKVTYSAVRPVSPRTIEKIAIEPGPVKESVEAALQRHRQISDAALELSKARQRRQAEREDEEKKRLERLALLNSAKPRIQQRTVYVSWNPLWHYYPYRTGHSGKHPHHKPSQRAHRTGMPRTVPFASGVSFR